MTNHEFNFKPGQRLLLELPAEILEGTFDSGSTNRIDLINIFDRVNNVHVEGKLSFYATEIMDIQCLDEPTNDSQSEVESGSSASSVLEEVEYERLKKLTQNFIYIDKADQNYNKAVGHLKTSESVSVFSLCEKSQEVSKIRLLVMSTTDQIYMFDLFVWKPEGFPRELSEILSRESIEKVVHNSRLLKASLWTCHGVELNNIFDTQVADAMTYEKDTGEKLAAMRNLSECLLYRLELPSGLLDKIANIEAETWEKRPLDYYQITQAAFVGTYLITLRNHLKRLMLKHVYNCVNIASNCRTNMSAYEAQASNLSNNIPEELKTYLAETDDLFM